MTLPKFLRPCLWSFENQHRAACFLAFLIAWAVLHSLYGCATFDTEAGEFEWYQERPPAKRPYSQLYIRPEDVSAFCNALGPTQKERRACTSHESELIVLPLGAHPSYLAHELRHQNGENHK